jgi:CRISPR/Cas system-associated protein endoribonuclease Cas2
MQQKAFPGRAEEVFAILGDKQSVEILSAASIGLQSSSNGIGDQTKKQYYVRLKRLVDMGLMQKQRSVYKLTTFGSIAYENHLKMVDKIVPNYWQVKSLDILKSRPDFPLEQKEKIMNECIETTGLKGVINTTHLSSFSIVKQFDDLIVEVLKVLDNAEKEIYLATRYHDPHVSNKVFEKFGKGVTIHILDGNPEQISVESRLAAIIRTPPNRETAGLVKKITKSSRFNLKRLPELPLSFMVVDGIQVVYDSVSFINPEQFTIAISKYDDAYMAQQFIEYFKLLSKDATAPKILEEMRVHPNG